jgi:two-component system sensor histidine kinase KdpD
MTDSDNGGVSTQGRGGSLSAGRVAAGWALVVVGLPVLTAALLSVSRGPNLSFEAMPYLVLAIACALVGGRWPAVAASVLGTFALNFWFTEPLHTLDISSARDIATLVVFVVTSLAVAAVVDSAARRRHRAVLAENEASTLAMLNRTVLGGEYDVPGLLALVRDTFGGTRAELVDEEAEIGPEDSTVPAGEGTRLVLRGRRLGDGERRVLSGFASHLGVLREREELARQTEAARELEAGNRTRTALLAAVSHDLRTPLAGIRSAAETLRAHDDLLSSEDRADLLEAIVQSTARLTTMVSDLLDMSRLQTGAVQPSLHEVSLHEVVDRALKDLDGAERVEVGPLPPALVDAALLERVLVNLLSNALRHSEVVEVNGSENGHRVQLRVADEGPGVAVADRTRMFEPFQRLGDTPSGDGVGLGLAVARGLTEAQGGSLVVEDAPGGGLVMVLDLAAVERP